MAGEYTMASLKRAEARRQDVLDWLHQHPGATMAEIEAGLATHEGRHLRGALPAMTRSGEIIASGPRRAKRFTAVAHVTASAESLLAGKKFRSLIAYCKRAGKSPDQVKGRSSPEAKAARLAGKARKSEERRKEQARAEEQRPGVMIHYPGKIPEITKFRSGGQGAVRARVTVNCHQNY